MSVTGWPGSGSPHGSLTPRSAQSQSVLMRVLLVIYWISWLTSCVLFAHSSLSGTGFSILNGHPGPLLNNGQASAGLAAKNSTRNRKNWKKHRHRPRSELKVTNRGEGRNEPVWSEEGPSSSSESSSGIDSGFSSTQKEQGVNIARATIQLGDQRPLLSPSTVKRLDARDFGDDPLSDCPRLQAQR